MSQSLTPIAHRWGLFYMRYPYVWLWLKRYYLSPVSSKEGTPVDRRGTPPVYSKGIALQSR